MRTIGLRALLMIIVAAQAASAQSVTGTVRSTTGLPLGGAQVRVLDSAAREIRTTAADTGGKYSIAIPREAHSLRAMAIGHRPTVVRLGSVERDTIIDFQMERIIVELDTALTKAPVTSTDPAVAEFEQRRRTAPGGKFIGDSVLLAQANTPLANILRSQIPGLKFVNYRGATLIESGRGPVSMGQDGRVTANRADPRAPMGCWANVYLDGNSIYEGPPAVPPDMMLYSGTHIAAVEYYQGGASLPLQFRTMRNSCGTLLLWTRRKIRDR